MIEKTFYNGKINLNYMDSETSGPPVLLLHGYSTRWQSFKRIVYDLAKTWHVYALDLRGHGKSGRANSYRIHDYVPDIISFIKDCLKEPAIIYGHSFGGMIGIILAAGNPELVKGLIVGDSLISPEALKEYSENHKQKTTFWRDLAKMDEIKNIISELRQELIPNPDQQDLVPAYQVYGENQAYFEFMATSYYQLDPEVLTADIERFEDFSADYQPARFFPEIKCPVLLLQGDLQQGALMRDQDVRQALSLLPQGQHIKVNTGHFLHVTDKEAVLKVLLPFMESLDNNY